MLDLQEKRAILSSWASDACSVESMPGLRQPPGADQPLSIDQIMETGLHEFLEDFILSNDKLATEINEGYRFYK